MQLSMIKMPIINDATDHGEIAVPWYYQFENQHTDLIVIILTDYDITEFNIYEQN
jgi:hypothetical protein